MKIQSFPSRSGTRRGFSLIEMMVATAVLTLMVGLLVPVFNSATSSTFKSETKLGVDILARQALDRIGRDLALLPMREDLDYHLQKTVGNDTFDFYSYVPGVLSGVAGTDSASGLTLVGYRIFQGNLERRAVAQRFNELKFLSYDAGGTLLANTGITEAIAATSVKDYQVLCAGVFRFEVGFLLKDGTFATRPMNEALNAAITSSDPGYRQWQSDATYNFAQVTVSDGTGGVVLRPLGWQDVAAVVVSLAAIDPVNATRATVSRIESAAGILPDAAASPAAPLVLPANVWMQKVADEPGSFGLPQSILNGVRIYQRPFYLNAP